MSRKFRDQNYKVTQLPFVEWKHNFSYLTTLLLLVPLIDQPKKTCLHSPLRCPCLKTLQQTQQQRQRLKIKVRNEKGNYLIDMQKTDEGRTKIIFESRRLSAVVRASAIDSNNRKK